MALLPSSIVSILIAFLFFSLSLSQEAELVVPVPQGPYAVGQKIAKLVNSSLQGSNIAEHEPRDVLISLFYPIQQSACKKLCVVPYVPPRTADFIGLGVDDVKIQICCETTEKAAKDVTKLPLVLFSPGLGATRLIYNAMAMDLAGAGYSVATIDHPIDTPIVEYPDGSYTMGLNSTYWDTATEEDFIKALDDRVTDARFVLAQLGQAEVVKELVPGAEGAYDVCHTGFYGHSFGGATALQTMMRDSRIAGGINIDGTQFGPVFNTTSPGVLFGRADPSPHNISSDASWPDAWDALKGWKRELGLKQSRHITFSDLPYYVKLSNISLDQRIDTLFGAPQNITIRDVVGDLDGGRSFAVVTTYVRAFMDFVLKGRETKLFEAAGAVPEIVVGETGE